MSVTGIFNGVQRIGSTAQGATDVLTRLEGGSFWAQLKPASFRGVPFVVQEGTSHFGRRNQIHEYPFRDTPWVEDLGQQARAFVAGQADEDGQQLVDEDQEQHRPAEDRHGHGI